MAKISYTWATLAIHSLAFNPFVIPSEDTLDRQNIFPAFLSTVMNMADVAGDKALTCFRAASNAYTDTQIY